MAQPVENPPRSLEEILDQIEDLPDEAPTFAIWIPASITFRGGPLTTEVAMAVIRDALYTRDFQFSGYEEHESGRLCRFERIE